MTKRALRELIKEQIDSIYEKIPDAGKARAEGLTEEERIGLAKVAALETLAVRAGIRLWS